MSQTIAIILRLREDEVDQFESLFRAHILPMWKQFQAAGKFLGASLSPVVDGSEMEVRSLSQGITSDTSC